MLTGDALPEILVSPPGPRSRELAERLLAVESPAFGAWRKTRGDDAAPIVYREALGANVVDADGNRFVDLTAGFGALILGHPPRGAFATDGLALALGDVYASEAKIHACEAIAALFPERGARVMLGLSGADAVTCALKTAMLATKKPRVVAFEGAYHGLSYGPLAACGYAPSFRAPFAEQLGVPVTFAPYGTLDAVRAALREGDVGAILVEPILGRGGIVEPPVSFLPALRSLADHAGALLIVDEIWTGIGRTGSMLVTDETGVVPDVICLGKALGGGAPISACVGKASVMEAWGAHGGGAIHTGTHFGSPPACAAVLATLSAVRAQGLAPRARAVGDAFRAELAGKGLSVRGRGLMVGIDFGTPARALDVMRNVRAKGYLVLTGGSALTLSPPLTIAPPLLSAFAHAVASC